MKFSIKTLGLSLFLISLSLFVLLPFASWQQISEESMARILPQVPEERREAVAELLRPYADRQIYKWQILPSLYAKLKEAGMDAYSRGELVFSIARETGSGWFWERRMLLFWVVIAGGVAGALIYIYPAFFDGMPGIKHNGIYFSSATNRGLVGMLAGAFLIGFYILLYFYHWLIAEWITLADPVSQLLRGEPASRWFMYGFLYTLAILVMGLRMFAKYRHNRYQQLRTASVMFFQTCFAFILPQILYQLHLPEDDLKNIWPLNYYFFFDWNINKHIESGMIGQFMLGWGILTAAVGVPVLTFFFGKRWYCSWVCGCGGLAETLGDPYRQLSDKSAEAWQIERFVIHGVLAFAVIMTGLTLYTYFSKDALDLRINKFLALGLAWAAAGGLYLWHRRSYPHLSGTKVLRILAVFAGAFSLGVAVDYFPTEASSLKFNSYDIRSVYSFGISSIFAGVVGTGFYPLMGSRVWCRFGCPLAAYLGLVQRLRSRFRITTNGGQCISCGNCSAYCEMGIDVRAYAQRGQNIVRSSCVGCGVCAAVCPRGVLALENGPDSGESRMSRASY
jgi:Pyruvate/2-oxoacid:ferredoxin oxidoreductase delta subunit